jgi:hypothetical protein
MDPGLLGTWTTDPKSKILIATWLASELWLNPWLFLVGIVAIGIGVALFVVGRRRTSTSAAA